MNRSRQPDPEEALKQWQGLYRAVSSRGVAILDVPPREGLPDFTFIANAGLPLPWQHLFILSSFYHSERQRESHWHQECFGQYYSIIELPQHKTFEGQGDAFFWDGKCIFICYGVRTNHEGAEAVASIISDLDASAKVILLRMKHLTEQSHLGSMTFYHGDMCLLPLRHKKKFFVYQPAFHSRALRQLEEYGEIISATKIQAHHFVCNGIEISDHEVIVPWADSYTRDQFAQLGYELIVCPTDQFFLAGGGPKCLVLELFD